jgi:hypothetical protein
VAFFGTRATSATLGLGLLAAFTGILAAGSSGPAPARYQVVAPLLFLRSGPIYACFSYDLMGGCGGIPVHGAVLGDLPIDGQLTVASVGITTGPVRLIGMWDGNVLTLSESPKAGQGNAIFPDACVQSQGFDEAPGVTPALEQRVIDDYDLMRAQHIEPLQFGMCDETTLGMVVVVADDAAVSWLTGRYHNIKIAGWLQPVPNGP